MPCNRSFVLSAAFPSSRTGAEGLRRAVDRVAGLGLSIIEYYVENCSPQEARRLLGGLDSVFLAGARQKAMGLHPCSPDREERERACRELSGCIRFAQQAGAGMVMLSSGSRPANVADDPLCLECLEDSLYRLHRVAPELPILLEPGDRDVEYRHLIGPTPMAVAFAHKMRSGGVPLGLIFDMSHAAQLGEELYQAWELAKPVCGHVHFANCVLAKSSPLYGDKHPDFGVADSVFSRDDAASFLARLEREAPPPIAGLEMICPEGENEDAFFVRLAEENAWFFCQ